MLDQIGRLGRRVEQLTDQTLAEVAEHTIKQHHRIRPPGQLAEPELLQPPIDLAQTKAGPP